MSFLEYGQSELTAVLNELGLPKFQHAQIRRWVFARKCSGFDGMTDLSKQYRQKLSEKFGSVFQGTQMKHQRSDDSAEKILIEWRDGERVESVLLRDNRNHRTACISTQIGCAMGCKFCASGIDGFVRNLTRGEILEQLLRLNSLLPDGERLTHIVVMGIGEPLLNLENLLSALDDATSSGGLDISVRRVTISTVGLPAGIQKLAEKVAASGKEYKLAVSLHAPNDELRTQIIPQNQRCGIKNILRATDDYFRLTGRRVTFEYTLIDGVNDEREHVRQLVGLLKHRTAIVNIIPVNPVPELGFSTPPEQKIRQFVSGLTDNGIQVKVRFRKGDKIDAACGQLRRTSRENTGFNKNLSAN
ncbi:MAG: 23S rRNA (adenine(2503)-C(2))-methyltransferase RlmN [Planctomycetaceae bacterium]|nr:23S rRNA (adenine(2503)-C(2))-methyltransferase RlmN [Planctomycetaceae bacterium]